MVSFDIPHIDEVRMVDAEKGVGRQYVFVFFEIFYRYDLFPVFQEKESVFAAGFAPYNIVHHDKLVSKVCGYGQGLQVIFGHSKIEKQVFYALVKG